MSSLKAFALAVLVIGMAIICFISLLLFMPWCSHRKTELAKEAQCRANQRIIYLAIGKYKDKHREIPQTLQKLVQDGLVDNKQLYCPCSTNQPYTYFPEHYAQPTKALLSEREDNHKMTVIETMGDGRSVAREPRVDK